MSRQAGTDKTMRNIAKEIATAKGIHYHEAVYVALPGPNLETPAEYNFLNRMGGDLVGMSTVPEVLVARHMGLACFCNIRCVQQMFPGRRNHRNYSRGSYCNCCGSRASNDGNRKRFVTKNRYIEMKRYILALYQI